MTEYLLSVHHDNEDEMPYASEEEMQQAFAQVDEFNTQLQDAGRWVFAGGLEPPSTATVVAAHDGEVVTTDGPFAEAKEFLGGFWVVKATDLDDALAIAERASVACMAPVEVRPFQAG